MPQQKSILKCLSCNRFLPRSAFDIKYAQRSGTNAPLPNGLHRRCRECRQTIDERINRPEYIVDPVTGCWNWNRGRTPNGYGMTRTPDGDHMTAHRFIYEREVGPIPDGLTLDHLCRNRACVNPSHLEPVPQVINCQRGTKALLDADKVREIRALKGVMPYREIGTQYGVAYSTIASIMNGSRWWNIEDEAA